MVEQISKFLRKAGTSRIFIWSPQLAERKDMVPYDPEMAKIQLEAAKNKRDALRNEVKQKAQEMKDEDITSSATELADVEREIKDLEQENEKVYLSDEDLQALKDAEPLTPEEERQKKIDEDEEIVKIKSMKKDEARGYLALEYGIDLDKSISTKEAREIAIKERTARIFEVKE